MLNTVPTEDHGHVFCMSHRLRHYSTDTWELPHRREAVVKAWHDAGSHAREKVAGKSLVYRAFQRSPHPSGLSLVGFGVVSVRLVIVWMKERHWDNEKGFWQDDNLIIDSLLGVSNLADKLPAVMLSVGISMLKAGLMSWSLVSSSLFSQW